MSDGIVNTRGSLPNGGARFELVPQVREFADLLPGHILAFDREGALLYANRAVTVYIGRPLEEMIELATAERMRLDIHPKDVMSGDIERTEGFARGKPFELERRARRKDGVYRWFLLRYRPVHDESGALLYWLCTGLDIEHTKRTDEQIRLAVDAMPAYIHSALPNGSVDYLNQRWLDYLGVNLTTLLHRSSEPWDSDSPDTWAMNLIRTIHPDDLELFASRWKQTIDSGTPATFEVRIRRADGEFRWFMFQPAPLKDEEGRIVKWYVASIDIDDYKRSEEDLRQKELLVARQLREAINTMPVLAWTARPDGSAEYLNDRWLEYSGLALDEALDWKFLAAVHPDDIPPAMEIYKRALQEGDFFEAEARIRRFDGEYRWFLFRGSPFRDESGSIVRWFGANVDIEDRKRAEDGLRASEHSLRLVIDTIPGLIHTTDSLGELETVSKTELDYFGRTFDELRDWPSYLHPDDLERITSLWQETIATERLYDTELRLRRADGCYRWIHVQGVPLRDGERNIIRWYFLMTDVNERKKAEEELKRNERYLTEGQRLSRTGSFSWKVSTQETLYLSEECLRIFGFDPAMGLITWDQGHQIINPAHRTRCVETIDKAIAEGSPYSLEYPIETPDGTRKQVRTVAHPVFNMTGEIVEFVGTVIDITEQHKAQEAMRETERHLRLLIETIPALVWCTNAEGMSVYANKQHQDYVGCADEDLLAMNWVAFIHPDDIEATRELWLRSIRTGERYERVQRIRRYDGRYRWFQTIAEPLRAANGSIIHWYGLNIDIDDSRNLSDTLKATQARLSRATQIATIAELSASIAHEINQPLGAVVATAHACETWLSADPPNLERAQIAVQRMIRDGSAAAEVIQRIRALFKQAGPNKVQLDINDVIHEVLRLVSHEIERKKIRVETDLSPNLSKVSADRVQMQQLMINLVHNAIEAMETVEKGPKSLILRSKDHVNGFRSVLVEVVDVGTGFEDAERIFESFYSTKDRGMGMGLSICRTIVDVHGGNLWATPNREIGTTFSFTLPALEEVAQ